jgi:hypothetical protein
MLPKVTFAYVDACSASETFSVSWAISLISLGNETLKV